MKPNLLYRKNGVIMQIKEEVDEHIIKQGSRKSLSSSVCLCFSSMAAATTMKKIVLLTVLCFLLMLQEFQVKNVGGGCMAMAMTMAVGGKMDCGSACNYRCSKASRTKMCIRACNTCCDRCNCVPPGTSGNKDVCPCYAEMTTHGGKLKCP